MDPNAPHQRDVLSQTLPIDAVLGALRAALSRGHAVLQAPTGSGKSTRVPLALLDEDWLAAQRILILQPRRPAARMIAARMAELLGEPLGGRVGYQIRFERRIGRRSRIEVMTEGLLTRRIQLDPALEGVGLVIFDEFHERSQQSDLGLSLALDVVAGLRPDLRLLLMSATLDAEPLAEQLGGAEIVRAEGRRFHVEVRYAERAIGTDPVGAVISRVRSALASHQGDVLAFLPGAAEINRCVATLGGLLDPETQILPLHGSLPTHAQEKALVPGDGSHRRVLVATDIAETSLTIPAIRVVIDSGLTRKPRFDPASGLTRLVTGTISRASADQRAGRAGRLGPGICYRLWTHAQEQGRPDRRTPEILEADLASLALELRLWGVSDPHALRWIDPPPAAAWDQAIALLTRLGALDTRGAITRLGRRMADLPVHPRLAAMLLGASGSARRHAADLCALVSERDPLLYAPGQRPSADLGLRLQALQLWRTAQRSHGFDALRLAATDRVSRQLQKLTHTAPTGSVGSPGELLALAYPERIAQRREGADGRYRLAGGSGARLPEDDALAVHPYLAIATLDAGGADGQIRLALPIAESEIRERFADRIEASRSLTWDPQREAVSARTVERLDALTLRSQPSAFHDTDEVAGILLGQISTRLEQALTWSEATRQLSARVALMRRIEPQGGWPDLAPESLRAHLEDWLAPYLTGMSRFSETRQLDLRPLLMSRLDWTQRQRLESEAPTTMVMPAGKSRRIDYCCGESPILAVQVQELFGLAATPCICGGRVPLLLHLLSPARRPIQVTQDLASFWERGYPEVRKELRGRYPKHAWPDDPTHGSCGPMTTLRPS
ncbi:MAG: ATP-dependent helicase HrpB [Thiocapsa sp.]|nr:ATP-dependent helicase HrpB [Thiocapsa sp.]MCG6896942.1 ATP-dependent helicase HrpB [Thiocapsa sp.]